MVTSKKQKLNQQQNELKHLNQKKRSNKQMKVRFIDASCSCRDGRRRFPSIRGTESRGEINEENGEGALELFMDARESGSCGCVLVNDHTVISPEP